MIRVRPLSSTMILSFILIISNSTHSVLYEYCGKCAQLNGSASFVLLRRVEVGGVTVAVA